MFCSGWQKWHELFVRECQKWHRMFCPGWQNLHGMFCPGGKSLWDILFRVSKIGMGCVVPGMFCPTFDRGVGIKIKGLNDTIWINISDNIPFLLNNNNNKINNNDKNYKTRFSKECVGAGFRQTKHAKS